MPNQSQVAFLLPVIGRGATYANNWGLPSIGETKHLCCS